MSTALASVTVFLTLLSFGTPALSQMQMSGKMQGGSAPPDARSSDYSDGLRLGPLPPPDLAGDDLYLHGIFDNLEYGRSDGNGSLAFDAKAWYGNDFNRLLLYAEGERADGRLGGTRLEALYSRAIGIFWGGVVGWRHDVGGGGPTRDWLALGVHGLAPYWFETQAEFYVGESGRTAARFEAEYDILLTQRLVLQPNLDLEAFGKSDPEREIGSGFSKLGLSLRLRYEITRQFAPYVGLSWSRKLGNTADFATSSGQSASETQFVVGLRTWF